MPCNHSRRRLLHCPMRCRFLWRTCRCNLQWSKLVSDHQRQLQARGCVGNLLSAGIYMLLSVVMDAVTQLCFSLR